MLKKVVLPAPFGPIRPTIDPLRSAKSTLLTATRPPKRLVMPVASSTLASSAHGAFTAISALAGRAPRAASELAPCGSGRSPQVAAASSRPAGSRRSVLDGGDVEVEPELAPATRVQLRQAGCGRASVSTTAPRMTPQMLPMPPRMTMPGPRSRREVELDGSMICRCSPERAGEARERRRPSRTASSFVWTRSMPIAEAASSSSRMAIQARPMREFCSR